MTPAEYATHLGVFVCPRHDRPMEAVLRNSDYWVCAACTVEGCAPRAIDGWYPPEGYRRLVLAGEPRADGWLLAPYKDRYYVLRSPGRDNYVYAYELGRGFGGDYVQLPPPEVL